MKLAVKFTDDSPSFVNGLEVGRIYAKMEQGIQHVDNVGFPVHAQNKQVLINFCDYFGYTPLFGSDDFPGWIEFFAIKNVTFKN